MTMQIRRSLTMLCMTATAFTILSAIATAQQTPTTTTEHVKGTPTVTTQTLRGKVVVVEGNDLVVRMSTGELRNFHVPESRKFVVDGQELSIHDLKPGTALTASVTTTTTPVTERTTTVGTGKVWYVQGNSVILTLPNGENRMYKVKDTYHFTVDGRQASVHDLRKGMTIAAEKIVEEPRTEIASNTQVTGHAPAPTPVAENKEPAREQAAPAAAAAPAKQEVAEANLPAKLPKTGGPLPLVGVLGLLFTGTSFCIRRFRLK